MSVQILHSQPLRHTGHKAQPAIRTGPRCKPDLRERTDRSGFGEKAPVLQFNKCRRILYGFERKSQRLLCITPVFMAARNAKQQPIGRHRPFETAARHPPRCHRTILLAIQEVPGPPIPAPPANPWKNAGRDAKESHRGAPTGSPAGRRPQLPLRYSLLSTLASAASYRVCKDCAYPRSQKGAIASPGVV